MGEVNLPPGRRRFRREEERNNEGKEERTKGKFEDLKGGKGSIRPDPMGRRILIRMLTHVSRILNRGRA